MHAHEGTCLSEERPRGCAEEEEEEAPAAAAAAAAARLEPEAEAWGLKVSGCRCSELAGMESER